MFIKTSVIRSGDSVRIEQRGIYLFQELPPEAQTRAIRAEYRSRADSELPWAEEMRESYFAILDALGVKVGWNGNPTRFDDEIGALRGPRAMAWAENNLVGALRIPWKGARRNRVREYGNAYYAGKVRPCPWTGFYADDEFLRTFLNTIREGASLDDAAQEIPAAFRKLVRQEWDQYLNEETIREDLTEGGAEFLENGARP